MTHINLLKKTSIFGRLPDETLEAIATVLRTRTFEKGEILFNQGDPGDELIIVETGKIAIIVPIAGVPNGGQVIRVFEAGECLGEMSLIDQKPRSTSARSEDLTTVLTLGSNDFQELLKHHSPAMAIAIMRELSDRVRYTTDFLSEVHRWIQQITEGNYQLGDTNIGSQDSALKSLASEFVQMATRVQEREENLRKEVAQILIEIDQVRLGREVQQITESDFFRSLQEELKVIQQERDF